MMMEWWTTALYEFKKYTRNSSLLLLMIGLPLLLIFILGSALDTEIKPAKIALIIEDEGELNEGIAAFWHAPALSDYVIMTEAETPEEVKRSVENDIVDYGVIVPRDFSERVISGATAEWIVYPGRNTEKNIAAEAVIGQYMAAINLELAALSMKVSGEQEPYHYSAEPSESTQSAIQLSRNADLIKVGTLNAGSNQMFDSVSAVQYYSAAYLIMFLLYNGMLAAEAVLKQRKKGTLQRLYAMPVSYYAIILGIISGAFMLAILQAVAVLLFTTYVYGVQWGGHYGWIAAICLLTIVSSMGIAFILASFKLQPKTVSSVFTVCVLVMTILSGGMIPNLSELLGGVDRFTLNYWSNEGLRTIMQGGDRNMLMSQVGVLAIITFALALIAAIRLPKVVNNNG